MSKREFHPSAAVQKPPLALYVHAIFVGARTYRGLHCTYVFQPFLVVFKLLTAVQLPSQIKFKSTLNKMSYVAWL